MSALWWCWSQDEREARQTDQEVFLFLAPRCSRTRRERRLAARGDDSPHLIAGHKRSHLLLQQQFGAAEVSSSRAAGQLITGGDGYFWTEMTAERMVN